MDTVSLSNVKDAFLMSSIIDIVQEVDLETNEECLLGSIDLVCMDDSLLFIMDQQQKSIFIFSNTGKFVRKIQNWGKGEGEYIAIDAFCIDFQKDYIYLYDTQQRKLLSFQYNGTFIKEVKVNDWLIRSIGILNNGNLIAFTPDLNDPVRDGVWEIDNSGKFVREYADVDTKYKFCWILDPCYCYQGGGISYYDVYKDEIHSIEDGKKERKLKFEIDAKMPEKFLYNTYGYSNANPTGDYYVASSFVELKDAICITYKSYGQEPKNLFLIYNKKANNYIVAKKILTDQNKPKVVSKIFTVNDNLFISIIDSNNSENPSIQIYKSKY